MHKINSYLRSLCSEISACIENGAGKQCTYSRKYYVRLLIFRSNFTQARPPLSSVPLRSAHYGSKKSICRRLRALGDFELRARAQCLSSTYWPRRLTAVNFTILVEHGVVLQVPSQHPIATCHASVNLRAVAACNPKIVSKYLVVLLDDEMVEGDRMGNICARRRE